MEKDGGWKRQGSWSVTSNQAVISASRLRAQLGVIHPSCNSLQQLAPDLTLTALPAPAGTQNLSPQAVPFPWPFPQPWIWEAKV